MTGEGPAGGARVALIDYGAGNLTSVRKALSALGAAFMTPERPGDLDAVAGIIVPGVGHFDATRAMGEEWRTAMRAAVDRGARLLGICLGMQWLFEGSTEAPAVPGMGFLRGRCGHLTEFLAQSRPGGAQELRSDPAPLWTEGQDLRRDPAPLWKVPHVGWNSLAPPRATRLLDGIPPGAQVYFTHSYAAPVTDDTAAVTTYGVPFAAAVERGRVAGVQFHPEKSGDVGLRILRNWLDAL